MKYAVSECRECIINLADGVAEVLSNACGSALIREIIQ